MGSFPGDVVYNILSWLSLKSLIRCKCVCKCWLSIIEDPAFVKLHLSRSESDPAILVLTYDEIGEERTITIRYMKHEGHKLVAGRTAIINMISSRSWRLVGTCGGLLCLATSDRMEETVMVFNPVTRENVILPKSSPCPMSNGVMLAFGFDPITKKYKVVRVLCSQHDYNITAEVYVLGDAGTWRKVRGGFNRHPSGRPVYADGAVHWLFDPNAINWPICNFPAFEAHYLQPGQVFLPGKDDPEKRIISFDLGKEEFRMMQHVRISKASSLAELGKRLSVVDNSSGTLVEVSVTDDYLNPNSWKKEYAVSVPKSPSPVWQYFPRLVCAHEHDGVLLIWLPHSLVSCEREGSVQRELMRPLFYMDWEICGCYRGSLVSLSHFDDAIEDRESVFRIVSDQELRRRREAYSSSRKRKMDVNNC